MASRYYAGVPGMNEQFGPMVAKGVSKAYIANKKHRQNPSLATMIITMILAIPVMPIAGGLMMLGESFKLLGMGMNDPRRDQTAFNIGFGFVGFVLGCMLYGFFIF